MCKKFILDNYFGKVPSEGLREKLFQPVFLKTSLDIVYSDIINWEVNELLDINFGIIPIEGAYKKTAICFMEYIWIKIVDQLRRYGFSYNDIIKVKATLSKPIKIDTIQEDLKANRKHYENKYGEEIISRIEQIKAKKHLPIESFITFLELIVVETITKKRELKLLFFKEYPGEVLPFSKEILETIENRGQSEVSSFYFQLDHFSFSFYKLFTPFLSQGKTAFDIKSISILSKNEHQLLTLIRRKFKNLKTINIRFKNQEITHIEVTETDKRVALETRMMDYIKKGDYVDIQIKTQDGRIVSFENTKKYKL